MFTTRIALRELDIGPEPAATEPAGTPSAAVVAGCVVAFAVGVTAQHARDTMQSLLLAQLAANAKASRHKEVPSWYRTHQSTMESIGWATFTSTGFARYRPPVEHYTIATVVGDTFRPRTTATELQCVERTVAALGQDSALPAQLVWECPSHTGGLGNFQVAAVTEEDGGAVTVQLGRFAFQTPSHVTRLAVEEFGPEAAFQTSYGAMVLDEDVFAALRSTIATKLDGRFGGSVAPVGPAS